MRQGLSLCDPDPLEHIDFMRMSETKANAREGAARERALREIAAREREARPRARDVYMQVDRERARRAAREL